MLTDCVGYGVKHGNERHIYGDADGISELLLERDFE